MKAPGIKVRPIKQLTGRCEFNEVFFTDVQLSDRSRLGPENQGWQVVITMLMLERFMIGDGFGFIGWQEILKLAMLARIAGKPAYEDGRVRERIAQWYIESEGLRLLQCRMLTALSKRQMPGPESSVIKIVAASQAQQAAYFAMDLRGRGGLMTSEELGPEWLDVEASWAYGAGMRIGGGTDEILRNVIAERVLGLPGDPRSDKAAPVDS
jgi:alkylation response protein AidB-like acyl-CoA dehydrogenase